MHPILDYPEFVRSRGIHLLSAVVSGWLAALVGRILMLPVESWVPLPYVVRFFQAAVQITLNLGVLTLILGPVLWASWVVWTPGNHEPPSLLDVLAAILWTVPLLGVGTLLRGLLSLGLGQPVLTLSPLDLILMIAPIHAPLLNPFRPLTDLVFLFSLWILARELEKRYPEISRKRRWGAMLLPLGLTMLGGVASWFA
jgi:hypothetical protein